MNALYSASLPCRMFIFLLDHFDCYYFVSNLSLVLLTKVMFMKKVHNVVFYNQSKNMVGQLRQLSNYQRQRH